MPPPAPISATLAATHSCSWPVGLEPGQIGAQSLSTWVSTCITSANGSAASNSPWLQPATADVSCYHQQDCVTALQHTAAPGTQHHCRQQCRPQEHVTQQHTDALKSGTAVQRIWWSALLAAAGVSHYVPVACMSYVTQSACTGTVCMAATCTHKDYVIIGSTAASMLRLQSASR